MVPASKQSRRDESACKSSCGHFALLARATLQMATDSEHGRGGGARERRTISSGFLKVAILAAFDR